MIKYSLLIIAAAASIVILRYIFIKMVDRRISNYQNDLISKQFNEMENMHRQMRGWRHDYHNHMQAMKAYLKLERYKDMDKYLDELAKDLTSIDTIIKSGNMMVDAILNSKLSLAISHNININAKATVPKNHSISDVDLCVIIGNLMDNAMEANIKIKNIEDRFIRVYIREMKEQLYISITNSVGGEVKKINYQYISTKLGINHGFGIKRIDGIVKKYNGFINRQNEEGVFATEIILPM